MHVLLVQILAVHDVLPLDGQLLFRLLGCLSICLRLRPCKRLRFLSSWLCLMHLLRCPVQSVLVVGLMGPMKLMSGQVSTCLAAAALLALSRMAAFSACQALILDTSPLVGLDTGAAALGPGRLL